MLKKSASGVLALLDGLLTSWVSKFSAICEQRDKR